MLNTIMRHTSLSNNKQDAGSAHALKRVSFLGEF